MTDKPVITNDDDEGKIPQDVCDHDKIHYSLLYKSVVCESCSRTWRDEHPILFSPTMSVQMQLPPEIEMLIRALQNQMGGSARLIS